MTMPFRPSPTDQIPGCVPLPPRRSRESLDRQMTRFVASKEAATRVEASHHLCGAGRRIEAPRRAQRRFLTDEEREALNRAARKAYAARKRAAKARVRP
jgi:hypothetical protein